MYLKIGSVYLEKHSVKNHQTKKNSGKIKVMAKNEGYPSLVHPSLAHPSLRHVTSTRHFVTSLQRVTSTQGPFLLTYKNLSLLHKVVTLRHIRHFNTNLSREEVELTDLCWNEMLKWWSLGSGKGEALVWKWGVQNHTVITGSLLV